MRVLHVTDCYLPRLGGIEVHVSDLVGHQRAAGIDARVITLSGAEGTADPGWVHRAGRRPGRDEHDPNRSLVVADAELRSMLAELRPDCVHVHVSVLSPFATLAARHASRAGLPTLVTVHSLWSRLGPLPAAAQSLLQLRRWPLQWSAVSEAAARPLREMLGPGIEVAVLPNAVDPVVWHPAAYPSGTATTASGPTLLSVMRFTRTKRALPLARMLLRLREVVPDDVAFRAVVVGDGPQRPAFERFVRRHRMDGWVDLPGRLDRAGVRDRLLRADCFVAPAELESFGIAALEARALGLPVVGSAQSGLGEFVRHGREGLLGADDREMIAAMARVVTDPGLRAAIRDHNRSTPIAHDWDAALRRTGRLYGRAEVLAWSRRTTGVRGLPV
ncbi:glycosyltransferase family 4 protein [Nocardioides conyzicola]|uniref:Glycosyltransferase n=1 Tax=Nocardioides conyzicola TaxID=1651781 RepID=A0ABP8WMS1_9ACTN